MKLAIIEWEDASSRNQWQHLDELKDGCMPYLVSTVGWIVSQNKRSITVCASISQNEKGMGDMTIPTRSIAGITFLPKKYQKTP